MSFIDYFIAPLSSLIWGSITIFAILGKPLRVAIFAIIAAMLSFFGIIHAQTVGIAQPELMQFVYAYLMVAGLFLYKYIVDRKDPVQQLNE